jgi:CDP-4-dehydro-6-deoxyglucose reductase, E1
MYKWPLNVSNFSWLDRLKICIFFLNPKNFWTQNTKVKEFEREMASFVGFKYSLFVSSGSTANTILAMHLRDKLKKENSTRNVIILPSTTWTTSVSPWIREGFEPLFIDVSFENFGMDLDKLENSLSENYNKVAAVFPTSLLGFNLNYDKLQKICNNYSVNLYIDQCENNFGSFGSLNGEDFNLSTSTTSTYMGHEIQSVEGGFIFTNNPKEYESFLLYRNHGMVRSLNDVSYDNSVKQFYENKNVDSRFDFYSLGNNFRNSDINAFIGLLDLKRKFKYIKKRRKLYGLFQCLLNRDRYILPNDDYASHTLSLHIPFRIPIICKGEQKQKRLLEIKKYCTDNSIETRPIISGFLGYQTAYKGFMDEKDYPNSVYLHNNGIYIGLNTQVKEKEIFKLVNFLNEI